MIISKYNIGDNVRLIEPGIRATVIGIRYTGNIIYMLTYWVDSKAEYYEAYEFELEEV